MEIKDIRNWPKNSHGAWVLKLIFDLYKSHGLSYDEACARLNTPDILLGGMNAVEFVEKLMMNGCESYTDAWHEVLGIEKRSLG